MRKSSFPPVTDDRTRVLILGSLPGEKSLELRQYYGHPQNRFWELLGDAIGVVLRPMAYPDRLDALLAHRVGLWDVVESATRRGSLDSAIRDMAANDLGALVGSLPELRAIAFNGRKAATEGRRQLAAEKDLPELVDLPSSSPAYAAMPYEEKAKRWRVIGEYR